MERTNEERLDLFAELIDPAAEIFSDPELQEIIQSGKAPLKAVKPAIKNHKKAVITMLAILEEQDPETYRVPAPGVFMMKVFGLFSRPEIQELFTLQEQKNTAAYSGPATGNIAAKEN